MTQTKVTSSLASEGRWVGWGGGGSRQFVPWARGDCGITGLGPYHPLSPHTSYAMSLGATVNQT
jgi:hypothetical protein